MLSRFIDQTRFNRPVEKSESSENGDEIIDDGGREFRELEAEIANEQIGEDERARTRSIFGAQNGRRGRIEAEKGGNDSDVRQSQDRTRAEISRGQ